MENPEQLRSNPEQPSIIQRTVESVKAAGSHVLESMLNTARRPLAIGASALALAGGTAEFSSSSADAEDQTTAATLKQRCVQAGLVAPEVDPLKLHHPGVYKRQYIPIDVYTEPMPEECRGEFRRLIHYKIQFQNAKHPNRWKSMQPYWYPLAVKDIGGRNEYDESPTGHEHQRYYYDYSRDKAARALFRGTVVDLSTPKIEHHKIIAQKVVSRLPIKILGRR